MKWRVLQLLVILSVVSAGWQVLGATNDATRDAAGFLIVPVAVTQPAVSAPPVVTPPIQATAVAPGASTSTSTNTFGLTGTYALDDKHKLFPGDKVSFQIVEDRTNAVPLIVAESSELDVPYIGRINVADKTCKEAAGEIKSLLEKDYYHRATVIIGLDSLSKVLGKVYVWGPVRQQGAVELPATENYTVGKAIGKAGGFGDFADKRNVKVIRKTPSGNITLKVNMVEVLERGKTDLDITLQPEDFIIVPQRAFNFN